jgi:D-alanyl-D-alanine carboxypeptidase
MERMVLSPLPALGGSISTNADLLMLRIVFTIFLVCLCTANSLAALTTDVLPPGLTELIRQARFKEHELSFFVQAVDEDTPALARQADKMGVLASTTKIPTTLAALDLLGSKFRWRTHTFARGQLQDGVLNGHLEIVGGGDPSLDAEGLNQLMQKLPRANANAQR